MHRLPHARSTSTFRPLRVISITMAVLQLSVTAPLIAASLPAEADGVPRAAVESTNASGNSTNATTVERRVASSADDAEEVPGLEATLTSTALELVRDGSDQTVGIRWTGLGIPRGATITAAYIQFTSKSSRSETTRLSIRGQAADNAKAFMKTSGNISIRALTSARVNWAPASWSKGQASANQRTPDLRTLIQEIVSRSGWASGNALVTIITGSGQRSAWSYDGKSSAAALLHVEFTSGGSATDNPPVARLSVTPASSSSLTVTADASGSSDTDATPIATYQFSFGDETSTVTTAAPASTANHTYSANGTYTVTLTATDTGAKTSAPVTASVTVSPTGTSSETIAVYAGYYDTHHSSYPKPKPSPWRGAADVVFVGTPDQGSSSEWDTSCIRIENLTSSSISGASVTVTMGSSSFALWGANTIPAGKSLIVAQTAFENFDGSDTSPAGCYGCNPHLCLTAVSSARPVVRVTIAGKSTYYVDSGQILNTKGVDGAGCPYTGSRNDESHAWQRIYPATGALGQELAAGSETAPLAPVSERSLSLAPPSPNPTRGDFAIDLVVPKRGVVSLGVYDAMGRLVKTYLNEALEAGEYRGRMNITESNPGVYFLRLSTSQGVLSRRFILVR